MTLLLEIACMSCAVVCVAAASKAHRTSAGVRLQLQNVLSIEH